MKDYFIGINISALIVQSICTFYIYSFILGGGLNDMYTHKGYVFLLLIGLLLYFIPSFIATKMNKKYCLQIFLLNLFLGFTFIGWLASLIWATIKTQSNEDYSKLMTYIIQIVCFLSFIGFCITDYHLFNYDVVKAKDNALMQFLLDSAKY